MKFIELSPKGNFQSWEVKRLQELKLAKFTNSIGQNLLFENDNFRLWEVKLRHKERLGFRTVLNDFSYTCSNDGSGVIHINDGRILFTQFKKGDVQYIEAQNSEPLVIDIENSGLHDLKLVLIELKGA